MFPAVVAIFLAAQANAEVSRPPFVFDDCAARTPTKRAVPVTLHIDDSNFEKILRATYEDELNESPESADQPSERRAATVGDVRKRLLEQLVAELRPLGSYYDWQLSIDQPEESAYLRFELYTDGQRCPPPESIVEKAKRIENPRLLTLFPYQALHLRVTYVAASATEVANASIEVANDDRCVVEEDEYSVDDASWLLIGKDVPQADTSARQQFGMRGLVRSRLFEVVRHIWIPTCVESHEADSHANLGAALRWSWGPPGRWRPVMRVRPEGSDAQRDEWRFPVCWHPNSFVAGPRLPQDRNELARHCDSSVQATRDHVDGVWQQRVSVYDEIWIGN